MCPRQVLLFAWVCVAPMLGCHSGRGPTPPPTVVMPMGLEEILFDAENDARPGRQGVEDALWSFHGIQSARVEKQRVSVSITPASGEELPIEEIEGAVERAGYHVGWITVIAWGHYEADGFHIRGYKHVFPVDPPSSFTSEEREYIGWFERVEGRLTWRQHFDR